MAWLMFVDTSRRTDYMLLLAITCVDAALTLVVALIAGLGPAAAGLTVFLAVLIGATWYAHFLWRREQTVKTMGSAGAHKIRSPR